MPVIEHQRCAEDGRKGVPRLVGVNSAASAGNQLPAALYRDDGPPVQQPRPV
jgi:hypothetical protein